MWGGLRRRSGPVRQLALALSAPLALARSVVSARCIGTSFVRSFFDPPPAPPPLPPHQNCHPPPLLHRATSLAEIQAAHSGNMLNSSVYHQPTPDKQPLAAAFAIYAHNSRRYLLEASELESPRIKHSSDVVFLPRATPARAPPGVCVCARTWAR